MYLFRDFFAKRESQPSRTRRSTAAKEPKSSLAMTNSDSVLFSELSAVLDKIEGTTKRLEITDYLTEFFATIMATAIEQEGRINDLVKIVYLCSSRVLTKNIHFIYHLHSLDLIMKGWNWGWENSC